MKSGIVGLTVALVLVASSAEADPRSVAVAPDVRPALRVVGPVESVDSSRGIARILGQTVLVREASSLVAGELVSVVGTTEADGVIKASRIIGHGVYVAGASQVFLDGKVEKVNAALGKAVVSGLTVDYTSLLNGEQSAPAIGASIQVNGIQPVIGGTVLASGADSISSIQRSISGGGHANSISGGGLAALSISGGGHANSISGGGHADSISGGGHANSISGGGLAALSISGGGHANSISGGGHANSISGGGHANSISGGGHADSISGGGHANSISGGGHANSISGGGLAALSISGGGHANSISGGGLVALSISGGGHANSISGGGHANSISGGGHTNSISGGGL